MEECSHIDPGSQRTTRMCREGGSRFAFAFLRLHKPDAQAKDEKHLRLRFRLVCRDTQKAVHGLRWHANRRAGSAILSIGRTVTMWPFSVSQRASASAGVAPK